MIVTTPIFRSLKEIHPNLEIGVFASETNAEIIRFNPFVDHVYVLYSNWTKLAAEIMKARKANYEVVLNLIFNRTTSGGILSNLVSPSGIKIGQGDEKYRFYFNRLLSLSRSKSHMLETLANIIRDVFNIKLTTKEMTYEIVADEKTIQTVNTFLTKEDIRPRNRLLPGKPCYIVFNLSANDSVRRISAEQALAIGSHLGSKSLFRTVLIGAPQDSMLRKVIHDLQRQAGCIPFPDHGNATLLEVSALIENAVAVITPDTSIIHIASAKKVPVLGFYTAMQDVHEWLPHQVKNRIVVSPAHEPTSAIPIPGMLSAIDEFIRDLNLDSTNK